MGLSSIIIGLTLAAALTKVGTEPHVTEVTALHDEWAEYELTAAHSPSALVVLDRLQASRTPTKHRARATGPPSGRCHPQPPTVERHAVVLGTTKHTITIWQISETSASS